MINTRMPRPIGIKVLPKHRGAAHRFENDALIAIPALVRTLNHLVAPPRIARQRQERKVGATAGAVGIEVGHERRDAVADRQRLVPVKVIAVEAVGLVPLDEQRLDARRVAAPALKGARALRDAPHDGVLAVHEGGFRDAGFAVDGLLGEAAVDS